MARREGKDFLRASPFFIPHTPNLPKTREAHSLAPDTSIESARTISRADSQRAPHNANLRRTRLGENSIGDAGAVSLESDKSTNNLEALDLMATGISSKGVEKLVASKTLGKDIKRQLEQQLHPMY